MVWHPTRLVKFSLPMLLSKRLNLDNMAIVLFPCFCKWIDFKDSQFTNGCGVLMALVFVSRCNLYFGL